MFFGSELAFDATLSWPERFYIRLLGAPISGLRIRARRVLPALRASKVPLRNILDAGCGKGLFTLWLGRHFAGAEVVGLDIETMLVDKNNSLAQQLGLRNCSFQVGDVTKLPFHDNFDLILSVDNLEHIKDHALAFSGFFRALRDKGRLVVHVPARERLWPFLKWRENFAVPGHERPGYEKEELIALVRQAGFKVDECRYTFGKLETWTNNISYMITGAEQRAKYLYAVVFPFLNLVAWFGQFDWPNKGAGLRLIAHKE